MTAGEALRAASTILILRTDAIGDNVLASAMLEPLKKACPHARLIVACQERVAELFENLPMVSGVVAFDRGRAYADEGYRRDIIARLVAFHADVVLNPMFTREPLCDVLVNETRAATRVGFKNAASETATPPYTHLISPHGGWEMELSRISEFLTGVGIAADREALQPCVHLSATDREFAANVYARNAIDPDRTIVLFAGALAEYRVNREIGRALEMAVTDKDTTIISVGAAHEFALHEELMRPIALRHLNLCGRSTLRQTAALLKNAQLGIGAETGSAHLACAVGTRNVVVLGGGHFGRFIPWSPLTTATCVPLTCYRCDWKCRYSRAYCITDVSASTIATAIRVTLAEASSKPRVVVQKPLATGMDAPQASDVRAWIEPDRIRIIEAPADSTQARIDVSVSVRRREQVPSIFRVTALVSTYNSERLMRGCLQDLVDQTLFAKNDLEILVIDSASPGNEKAIVQEFQQAHGSHRIRYLRTISRETLYAAWNRGIEASHGTYLTNANTDDRHHPMMLEILAQTLDTEKECVLAYADSDVTHEENASWTAARRVGVLEWPNFSRESLFEKSFAGPHPLWRRSVHKEVGYFDASMKSSGDYEFWLRLAVRWPFAHVPQRLGLYLENPQSLSLGNVGIGWYESRVARERYWKKEWGENPGLRHVARAFRTLSTQADALPPGTRVAIFGAGQHTLRHVSQLREALEPHVQIVAVLDDRASTESPKWVGSWPVVLPSRYEEWDVQAIVISSDTYEAELRERARQVVTNNVPVLGIYGQALQEIVSIA